ncbi:methyltransferase domain-containing protein [Methanobacterium oryzae]|uniref:methyltransferase domain-containing protein n=1 Tax=Methanobacterium oryzae TaxID=69540 RepID=UPI003D240825
MENKSKITGPIFTARSLDEYIKMFDLDLDDLKNKNILDCAAGASSFTANMTQKGFDVKAVDLLYDKEPQFLKKKCENHLKILIESLSKIENHFKWDFFKNLNELKEHRIQAQNEFFDDYKKFRNIKYIKSNLNSLPFNDNSFSLILCSHLLFIYDHRLSYNFHINVIEEMIRVSNEIRIYPLVKHKKKKSEFLIQIMDYLRKVADFEIVEVNYEFRKGGNEMLKITKQ